MAAGGAPEQRPSPVTGTLVAVNAVLSGVGGVYALTSSVVATGIAAFAVVVVVCACVVTSR